MVLDSYSDGPRFISPPPFYALDLLSVVPSSTHSPCAVYSLLVCLQLAGIVKNYVFFTVSVSSLFVLALNGLIG